MDVKRDSSMRENTRESVKESVTESDIVSSMLSSGECARLALAFETVCITGGTGGKPERHIRERVKGNSDHHTQADSAYSSASDRDIDRLNTEYDGYKEEYESYEEGFEGYKDGFEGYEEEYERGPEEGYEREYDGQHDGQSSINSRGHASKQDERALLLPPRPAQHSLIVFDEV